MHDVLYKYVQRSAHVEVEREVLIKPGRQERSGMLVRGLQAALGATCTTTCSSEKWQNPTSGGASRTKCR